MFAEFHFILDLENPASFRDLSKPIGALNDERLARMKVTSICYSSIVVQKSLVFLFLNENMWVLFPVPWVGLWSVIVALPGHTFLLTLRTDISVNPV